MLTPPSDIFCRIEKMWTRNPSSLSMSHYHSNPDGTEALTVDEVKNAGAHCLIGAVIALTPGAIDCEYQRDDMLGYCNQLLANAGKPPLSSWVTIHGTTEDALCVVKGRAAEERALAGIK